MKHYAEMSDDRRSIKVEVLSDDPLDETWEHLQILPAISVDRLVNKARGGAAVILLLAAVLISVGGLTGIIVGALAIALAWLAWPRVAER